MALRTEYLTTYNWIDGLLKGKLSNLNGDSGHHKWEQLATWEGIMDIMNENSWQLEG